MAQKRISKISLNMEAFNLLTEKIGPLELRPWTIVTQMGIEKLLKEDFTETEQAIALAWMQSHDPKHIRECINENTLATKAREFIETFPLALLKSVAAWCKRQSELIEDGKIEVVPRFEPDPKTPPN